MKRLFNTAWKIAAGFLLLCGIYFGLAVWAETGRAPYLVASTADATFRLFSGVDPISRCFKARESNGVVSHDFIGPRKCYDFGPQQSFSGIYFDEFEGQVFLENARPAARYKLDREVWLSFDKKSNRNGFPIKLQRDGVTRVWHVRFVGRKAVSDGEYGHLGMSESEVLVDKILDAKFVTQGRGYLSEQLIVRPNRED